MSELAPGTIEQASNSHGRMDILVNRAQGAAAVLLASLAFSAIGTAIKGPPEASASTGKPKQAQEYVDVIASDPGGAELSSTPKGTFVFIEQCESNSQKISRKVVYNKDNQTLGKCDIGSKVTITEKQPLQGGWIHQSGIKKVLKATKRNNHFTFIEQTKGASTPAKAPAAPESVPPTPPPSDPGGENPPPPPPPENPYASGNVGVDVSWPQCDTPNETPTGADFGIVGVTAGLGYSTNPCLASEAANFPGDELNLYVNTAWNSSSSHIDPNSPRVCEDGDQECLAYNYGYNAGVYAYDAAANLGISSDRWWLDVESDATWSANTQENQQSLQGEHDALLDKGATTVGVYSTTAQWNDLAGGWKNNWPSWGATSWETAEEARTYCTGHEFTGGPSEMMQFLPPNGLDYDVSC